MWSDRKALSKSQERHILETKCLLMYFGVDWWRLLEQSIEASIRMQVQS